MTGWPRPLAALQSVLDNVRILSPERFRLFDETIETAGRPPLPPTDDFYDPDPLASLLHRRLYLAFHARATSAREDAAAGQRLVTKLAAANAGRDRLDRGWTVVETLANGGVVAEQRYRTRRWSPGEFLSEAAPQRIVRGTPIQVHRRREARGLQAGFHYMFGAAVEDTFERAHSVRYYFNLGADTAASAIALLTHELSSRALPFALKCANSPGGFERCDPCVLYLGARHAQVAHLILAACLPGLGPQLRPAVPILTEPLAPGLAFAEEPSGGDSFGSHRMRAVARGLLAAYRGGRDDTDGRRAAVLDAFVDARIDRAAPHLAQHTGDPFGLRRLRFTDAD